MKKQKSFFLLLLATSMNIAWGQIETPHSSNIEVTTYKKQKMVWFRYKDEPIITLVNDLAALRGINIMLPQGANALTAKLTFQLPRKITLEKAWDYMLTILNMAGFTIIPHKDFTTIVKNDANTNKESLPFYVGVAPEDLPDTDLKIRYLYYLKTLQVPGAGGGTGALQTIFTQMLTPQSMIIYEPQQNAVLITDDARNIRSTVMLINEFDNKTTFEYPHFITLEHTSPTDVKSILSQLIPDTSAASAQFGQGGQQPATNSGAGYFPKDTKIVAEPRLNKLILLGKKDATERIVGFIKEYIDIPQEDGESILHVYDLQYLKAENFAPILTTIVQNQSNANGGGAYGSGTGQSTSSGGSAGEQYFNGVIITTEGSSGDGGGGYGGGSVSSGSQNGNRLIIAALKDDWIRIEKLIEELDKPQLQVMIHGLIVDLSYTAERDFAHQIRNLKDLFVKNVNWQTGHIAGIETETGNTTNSPSNVDALQANLLPGGSSSNYSVGTSGSNMASNASSGSFILSFKDPKTNGIWLVSKMLSQHTDTKVLSQPFLTGINNQTITFNDTITQRVDGASSQQYGVEVSNKENLSATIQLQILPRINTDNMINLGLNIQVNQFKTGGNGQNQDTRNVITNVNLYNGDILILGGLTKTQVQNKIYKTPILGDIPLIGNLFRQKAKIVSKSNLMIFLRPEIISLSDNMATERMFAKARGILEDKGENFTSLKDPISRWFFGKNPHGTGPEALEHFQEATESEEERLERQKRLNAIPVPHNQKEKLNLHVPKIKNTEKATAQKEEPQSTSKTFSDEDKVQQELQELFGWQSEDDRTKELDDMLIQDEEAPDTELSKTESSDNEEAQVEQELKTLLTQEALELEKIAD